MLRFHAKRDPSHGSARAGRAERLKSWARGVKRDVHALYLAGRDPRVPWYAKAMAKARDLPADTIILDLEDSVAPDAKPDARERVVEAVRAGGFGAREVLIRVNGLHTPWGEADLEAAVAAAPDGSERRVLALEGGTTEAEALRLGDEAGAELMKMVVQYVA